MRADRTVVVSHGRGVTDDSPDHRVILCADLRAAVVLLNLQATRSSTRLPQLPILMGVPQHACEGVGISRREHLPATGFAYELREV
jgi:hypothetical protein